MHHLVGHHRRLVGPGPARPALGYATAHVILLLQYGIRNYYGKKKDFSPCRQVRYSLHSLVSVMLRTEQNHLLNMQWKL